MTPWTHHADQEHSDPAFEREREARESVWDLAHCIAKWGAWRPRMGGWSASVAGDDDDTP